MLRQAFVDHAALVEASTDVLIAPLEAALVAITASFRAGGKVLTLGNGGSAADAQHFAAELVVRYRRERGAMAAIALTVDSSALTAIANDVGFEQVFSRQIEALARPGDVVVALSTSGASPNVVRAAAVARSVGCTVVAFTGAGVTPVAEHADVVVAVPSTDVARIQEMHELCLHALADELEAIHVAGDEDSPA